MNADEEEDFTDLVQRQARFVFRIAFALVLNPHDAEDAVQEIFLKLYRNSVWRNLTNERAFLARVTWRVALDYRRHIALHKDSNTLPPADLPSPWLNPEQFLLATNRHALVHSLIDGLPKDLRLALVLSTFDELNSREIAGILGIPEGNVRTRLQRARQVLHQKLTALEETFFQETRHV